ncbi:cytosolic phospholipase A2 gamma isoform X2 [Amia ocellicauda]|uniref:cytosolic phospholipase A2 gamma isoform X2 n=1 Tax=Amia ocellicauda TaxID=2972642 RepID=UPI003464A0E8
MDNQKEKSPTSRRKTVRVSKSLCEKEVASVQQRQATVIKCLQKLSIPCDATRVPTIAVLGSGGGNRAMVSLMGTLSEMKTQNLLDSILYLCGVSGSTWCMSALYKDKEWSSQVEETEKKMVKTLTSEKVSFLKILGRITEAAWDENCSLTDFWAGTLVYSFVKKEDKLHLSSNTDETMVNPYPIYAVVDKWRLNNKDQYDKGIWFEFTRHEAGYPGYGAFVDTSVFGSRLMAGEITESKKEMDMLYLQGLCGSAIGNMRHNIKFMIDWIIHSIFRGGTVELENRIMSFEKGVHCDCKHCTAVFLLLELHEAFHSGKDCKSILHSLMATQEGEGYKLMSDIFETWEEKIDEEQNILVSEITDFVCGTIQDNDVEGRKLLRKMCTLYTKWIWGTKFNFMRELLHPELPDELIQDETIHLIDAGLSNNCAYPLVLRAERNVKLILSFDFSEGDPFLTVRQAAEYSKKNNISFPFIPEVSEEEKACPSDCYIYRGKNTPTVMHFPLFNKVNCGDAEKIKKTWKIYTTARLQNYTKKEIEVLLAASKSNVRNNRDKIITEIKKQLPL